MNIAELFVKIGITGTDKSVQALSSVEKGMTEIKESSLAAKAAIIGAVVALEQMMAGAAARGMDLEKFANLTGESTKYLQQWQYAMAMTGVKAEETTSAFVGLQKKMLDIQLHGNAPVGMKYLYDVGFDINKAGSLEHVVESMRKAAKMYKDDPRFRNMALGSFGLSDNFLQGLGRAKPEETPSWAITKDKDIKSLADTDRAMTELRMKMARMFDNLTIKHGPQMFKDIERLIVAIDGLLDKILTLSERFKVFSTISQGIEGAANLLEGKDPEGKKASGPASLVASWSPLFQLMKVVSSAEQLAHASMSTSKLKAQAQPRTGGFDSVSVINNIHGMKHPEQVGEAAGMGTKKAVQSAVRQNQGKASGH